MSERPPRRGTMAGGFLIAAGVIGGAIIGIVRGEPSAGVVIGIAVGVAAAILVWLVDRRR